MNRGSDCLGHVCTLICWVTEMKGKIGGETSDYSNSVGGGFSCAVFVLGLGHGYIATLKSGKASNLRHLRTSKVRAVP